MGRQRWVNTDYPRNLRARKHGFYFDSKDSGLIPLGKDEAIAIAKCRELNAINEEAQKHRQRAFQETGLSLLLLGDILARARKVVPIVGIYFLVDEAQVVYVGQSVNVTNRIVQHDRDKVMKFDSASHVECAKEELDALEAAYIRMLRPKYNITFNTKWADRVVKQRARQATF
jgi:hypothetical protein